MAVAVLQTMKKHRLPNPLHRRMSAKTPPHNEAECQKQRQFVAEYRECAQIVSPTHIASEPRNQQLGCSSRSLRAQDFDLVKTLGTGTFARVWLSKLANAPNGCANQVYALKILRKVDIIRLKQVEHVRNERSTLGAVAGHPFITTLITTFSDNESLYMLLDYCPGGEVFTYLRRATKFEEPVAKFYAAEIALVLEYLHGIHGIAYRDMKPENILIDANGHLKLVDFGFAKKVEKTETYTLCGTPEYLAPEVIRNTGHGMAVDWWALGILLYEFLVGQPPFWDENPMKIYSKIVTGEIVYPEELSENAKSLIKGLCTVNPSERLGNIAGGSQSVKEHPFFSDINFDDLYYRKCQGPILPKVRHAADSSNYDSYDPAPEKKSIYTKEMQQQYEVAFKDF